MSAYELKRDDLRIDLLADSPAGAEDVVSLWLREAGLEEQEARRRIDEVLHVATDGEGRVAGLTTAYLARSKQLAMEMWHVRGFVSAPFRSSNLASNLVFAAKAELAKRFAEGREPSAPGIVMEIENLDIERIFPQAVWPVSNMTFFGVSPGGAHLRVYWFADARVPAEPPGAY